MLRLGTGGVMIEPQLAFLLPGLLRYPKSHTHTTDPQGFSSGPRPANTAQTKLQLFCGDLSHAY